MDKAFLVGYETQYTAVSAETSKHFTYRVYRSDPGLDSPGELLRVLVKPGVSRRALVEHLDRIRDWIAMGEDVQDVRSDTFYCDLYSTPPIQVINQGKRGRTVNYVARFPRGEQILK